MPVVGDCCLQTVGQCGKSILNAGISDTSPKRQRGDVPSLALRAGVRPHKPQAPARGRPDPSPKRQRGDVPALALGACLSRRLPQNELWRHLMLNEKPLAGKVAWVTGSSRGLGRVMATKLCRLGAAVALHGTRADSPRPFGERESMEQVARDVAAEPGGVVMRISRAVMDEAEGKRT